MLWRFSGHGLDAPDQHAPTNPPLSFLSQDTFRTRCGADATEDPAYSGVELKTGVISLGRWSAAA
jgi:hypothetical protein